jgi:amino acid adenylation domain-containing protein
MFHPHLTEPDCCVDELFERIHSEAPDRPALFCQDRCITRGELNSWANRIAVRLRSCGVGPERLVGICLPRSPELIAVVLGVLKAGGAYVPLDPNHPRERIAHIIQDSRVAVVIASESMNQLDAAGTEIMQLDGVLSRQHNQITDNPKRLTTAGNAICVNYTSGSFGVPKGVVRTHRGIVNPLAWAEFDGDDVCGLNMSLAVGFSLTRLFLPLVCGVPLAIVPEQAEKDVHQLLANVDELGITNLALPPVLLREILTLDVVASRGLAKVKTVTTGGSVFSPDLVEVFSRVLPHAKLFNQYASTEAGPVAIAQLTRAAPSAGISIGRPVANVNVYVLDEQMKPVSTGDCGELYVQAPHLARGYLNQPSLTEERFLPNPFEPGGRIYRTGDRGSRLPDGTMELLGRTDRQVKIRGFRVELEEIENVMNQHRTILESAATTCGAAGDERLLVYIATKSTDPPNLQDLYTHIQVRLPNYMVPSRIVHVDSIPRNTGGKVDWKALPAPGRTRPNLATEYTPPGTAFESRIADIWAQILDIDTVGVNDNFVELGGDSLGAFRVCAAIGDLLGKDVAMAAILDRTVRDIAYQLRSEAAVAAG